MELEVTYGRAARVWWSWTWRTLVVAIVCGIPFLVAFVITSNFVVTIPWFPLILISPIFVLKKIINKNFSKFRLSLIVSENGYKAEAEASWKIVSMIWWANMWRYILFFAIPSNIIDYICKFQGVDKNIIKIMDYVLYIPSILISIWIMKIVLNKTIKGFKLVLVAKDNLIENKANA